MKKQQEIGKKSGLQRSKIFNLELTNKIISMFVNMPELFFQSATKPCELELCRLRSRERFSPDPAPIPKL